jgi:hypothetical protein
MGLIRWTELMGLIRREELMGVALYEEDYYFLDTRDK